jgi:hypothetical protein
MTYLILDTNVWFYLANSYNPKNQNFEDDLHFKLVEMLAELVNNEEITILTNEIIIEEWKRNKEVAKNLIKKHQKSIEGNKGHVNNIKKFLVQEDKSALDDIFEKYINFLNQVIENNERHISQVETLLVNKTEKVEITQDILARAANRAINKLAPFKGDKSNSMADAVILLSSIEYLKKISKHSGWDEDQVEFYIFPSSTFVTINKGDFANPDNENEIHPELKPVLEEAKMEYEANIGRVLNTIKAELINRTELEQIEREMEEEYWIYCEVCDPDPERMYVNNIIEFGEPIKIDNELIEYNDPNQMKLFDLPAIENKEAKEVKRSDIKTVQFGSCTWCNAEYIKCQYCGTVNHVRDFIDDNRLECEGCNLTYEFIHRYIGDGMHETEIKIINEENEEE